MTIWTLFSIANEYNQPKNDLRAWWSTKPTFRQLSDMLEKCVDLEHDALDRVWQTIVGKIYRGLEQYIGQSMYRLEEIEEGEVEDCKVT